MLNIDNLPSDLLNIKGRWVVWRGVTRNGIMTKLPYIPHDTARFAKVNLPETWGSLFDARMEANRLATLGQNAGGGVVLDKSLGLICIDLDDVHKTINPTEARKLHAQIIAAFTGRTYIEASPSFKGSHIWLRGELPDGKASITLKDKAAIEIYSGDRYMTVTGEPLPESLDEITDQTPILLGLLGELERINGGPLGVAKPVADSADWEGATVGGHSPDEHYGMTTRYGRRLDMTDTEVALAARRRCGRLSDEEGGGFRLDMWASLPGKGYGPDRSKYASCFIGELDKFTGDVDQLRRIFESTPIGQSYMQEGDSVFNHKLNRFIQQKRDENDPILKAEHEGRLLAQENIAAMRRAEAEREALAEAEAAKYREQQEHLQEKLNGSTFTQPPLQEVQPYSRRTFSPPAQLTNAPRVITEDLDSLPCGILGLMTQDILNNIADRKLLDYACASALGIFAGLCGHAYSLEKVNGAVYMLVLGQSGQGKEMFNRSARKMRYALSKFGVPATAVASLGGPNAITSAPGFHQIISSKPTMYAVIGESIPWLRNCSMGKQANLADVKRYVLDLYGKNGKGETITPSNVVTKDNKLQEAYSPAVSLTFEGLASDYYEMLGTVPDYLTSGLCARMIHIETPADYVEKELARGNADYSNEVLQRLAAGCNFWHELRERQDAIGESLREGTQTQHTERSAFVQVHMTSECFAYHQDFDRQQDRYCFENKVQSNVYNRIVPNVLRVCVLLAVSQAVMNLQSGQRSVVEHGLSNPVVTLDMYQWAQSFVLRGINRVMRAIDKGDVGAGENKVVALITAKLKEWQAMMPSERRKALAPLCKGKKNEQVRLEDLSLCTLMPWSLMRQQLSVQLTAALKETDNGREMSKLKTMAKMLEETGEIVVQQSMTLSDQTEFSGMLIGLADGI